MYECLQDQGLCKELREERRQTGNLKSATYLN